MAMVPEKLDENKIAFLANEIARTYMTGKMSSRENEFINSYMDMYDKAKKVIYSREQQRIQALNNVSIDDIMTAEATLVQQEEQSNARFFR